MNVTKAINSPLAFTVSSFGPLDLPNLKVWLDANDLSTITKDGSNAVSSWADKSGNGYDVIQGTTTQQPIYNINGFGTASKPYISFDGLNDTLINAPITWGGSDNLFIVCKINDVIGSQIITASIATSHQSFISSGGGLNSFNGSVLTAGTVVSGTPFMFNTLYNGFNSDIQLNNNAIVSGDSGIINNTLSLRIASVDYGVGFYANIDIVEIIISGELIPQERIDLNNYANAKYGIY
jgi:hypothetical protein